MITEMEFTSTEVQTTTSMWRHWEARFQKSKVDLLSEYVDPVEERHMQLDHPPVESSKKTHKRKSSDISTDTATTAAMSETESDHSFLDQCFKVTLYNNNDNDPLRFLS